MTENLITPSLQHSAQIGNNKGNGVHTYGINASNQDFKICWVSTPNFDILEINKVSTINRKMYLKIEIAYEQT